MPFITQESLKERQLREQRKREANDAVSGRMFYTSTSTPTMKVEATKYELCGVEVSRDAQVLFQHLDHGQEHIFHGAPAEQTDAQLAETYSLAATTPEHIATVLDELVEKRLIVIEERQGKRFINTTTARTCGLG